MAELPTYPGAPRWVKVFGIVALAVVPLLATMMLVGGGPGVQTPSAAVSAPS